MDKNRSRRMDIEAPHRDGQQQHIHAHQKEEVQAFLKKVKKTQSAYIKNTEWMFSNQHFEQPLEHMSSYYL